MSSGTFLSSEDLEGLLDEVIRDLERLSVSDVRGVKCVNGPPTPPPSPTTNSNFKTCTENVIVSHLGNHGDAEHVREVSRKELDSIPVRNSHEIHISRN